MISLDVVLVHGLYHQPAHMDPLTRALERRGARVFVPALHQGSLERDVSAVQQVVEQCVTPPILVGHSYGGAVIADVSGGRAYVFIAAFTPDVDESCAELGGPEALVNAWVRRLASGGSYIPADFARDLFYADCTHLDAAHATDLLIPQAGGHGRGIVQRAHWKDAPSHYVICSDDRAVSPVLQQQMAQRCDSSQHIAASHSPYISRPDLTAQIIINQ